MLNLPKGITAASISLTLTLYHRLKISQAKIYELIDGVQIRYIPIIARKAA